MDSKLASKMLLIRLMRTNCVLFDFRLNGDSGLSEAFCCKDGELDEASVKLIDCEPGSHFRVNNRMEIFFANYSMSNKANYTRCKLSYFIVHPNKMECRRNVDSFSNLDR